MPDMTKKYRRLLALPDDEVLLDAVQGQERIQGGKADSRWMLIVLVVAWVIAVHNLVHGNLLEAVLLGALGGGAAGGILQAVTRRRRATGKGPQRGPKLVVLGLTERSLFKRESPKGKVLDEIPLGTIRNATFTEKRVVWLFSTWRLVIEADDQTYPLSVWISCFSPERMAVEQVRAFGRDLLARVDLARSVNSSA
jgi:hypothetical protein